MTIQGTHSRCLLILLGQGLLCSAVLFLCGLLEPQRQPDTQGYEQTPWSSPRELLLHQRTPGYGVFLVAVRTVVPGDAAIPWVQFGVHITAVCLFWWGLSRWSQLPVLSCAAASILLYCNILLRYVAHLTPDLLAASVALAALGVLLEFQSHQRGRWGLVFLGLLLASAWLLRPVYVFLVPLVPLLDVLLAPLRPHQPEPFNLRRSVRLLCAGILPLLLWCGCRWGFTGSMTPVAFGGNHIAALMCNFGTEADTAQLSPFLQPLWTDLVRHRAELEAASKDHRPLPEWFANPRSELVGEAHEIHYTALPSDSYSLIEARFVLDVWGVCTPVAQKHVGNDWGTVDRTLGELGAELRQLHPVDYGRYVVKACIRGSLLTVTEQFRNLPNMIVLGGLALLLWVQAQRMSNENAVFPGQPREWFRLLVALWVLAGTFAAAKVLCVALTTPPITRFTDAAGMLWGVPVACSVMMRFFAVRDAHQSKAIV